MPAGDSDQATISGLVPVPRAVHPRSSRSAGTESATRLRLVDVRGSMPSRGESPARAGDVVGVAIHHSATAHAVTGLGLDDARSIFEYQVARRGWSHGGYHYCVLPNGVVQYCLDESVGGFHAGFVDPDDRLRLQRGQFWNEHYLAVCVVGWFETGRTVAGRRIPDRFVAPTATQWSSLVALVANLCTRFGIATSEVRGHRELIGCATRCPGLLDVESLRREIADGAMDAASHRQRTVGVQTPP